MSNLKFIKKLWRVWFCFLTALLTQCTYGSNQNTDKLLNPLIYQYLSYESSFKNYRPIAPPDLSADKTWRRVNADLGVPLPESNNSSQNSSEMTKNHQHSKEQAQEKESHDLGSSIKSSNKPSNKSNNNHTESHKP